MNQRVLNKLGRQVCNVIKFDSIAILRIIFHLVSKKLSSEAQFFHACTSISINYLLRLYISLGVKNDICQLKHVAFSQLFSTVFNVLVALIIAFNHDF